jgi:predicted RNase H-like HicB family nuclease
VFAIGGTRDEAKQLIREAIELHIQSLREHGEPVPKPHSSVEIIAVSEAG